jgi:peptide/nickel transport system substrate-binding protein
MRNRITPNDRPIASVDPVKAGGGRRLGIAAAVGASLCVSGALVATASSRTVATKPVLTIGANATPVSLDPAKDYTTFWQWRSLSNTSIIHVKPDGTFGPGLATSWKFYDGGRGPNKDFQFTLRHDARFSDGTSVNAAAVVTWLKYFQGATGLFQPQMGPIRSINAVGNWTVQIHLNTPNSLVPDLLSEVGNWGAVESPKGVADPNSLGTQTFGAGPYMIDPSETVANSQYTYVPNPYYYDKSAVHWSKVVVKVITDPSTMLQAIRTGQIQVAAGDVTTAGAATSDGNLKVLTVSYGAGGLAFSDRGGHVSKPLQDVRVRQALNYAVDRKTICSALYGRFGSAATTGMPATDAKLPKGYKYPYTYDVAKAKSLLKAAGYANGFSVKMLAYAPLGVDGSVMPQAIAKYFSAVGVDLQVTTATTAGQYVAARSTKQYPIESNTLGLRALMLDYTSVYFPKGTLNPFGDDDKTLDALYVKALHSTDPTPAMDSMVQRITSQAYTLNVCNKPRIYYIGKTVAGASMNIIANAVMASELYPK